MDTSMQMSFLFGCRSDYRSHPHSRHCLLNYWMNVDVVLHFELYLDRPYLHFCSCYHSD